MSRTRGDEVLDFAEFVGHRGHGVLRPYGSSVSNKVTATLLERRLLAQPQGFEKLPEAIPVIRVDEIEEGRPGQVLCAVAKHLPKRRVATEKPAIWIEAGETARRE